MMKKLLKRTGMVLLSTILLTTANCFATTNEEIFVKDNIEYIKRTYIVSQEQENDFLLNLEKEFKIDKKTYQLESSTKTGGDIIETIDINTTKTIKSDSNKTSKIIEKLQEKIKYDKNDFIGTYKLDINSINIKTQYNGYKEYLIEDTKTYSNLDTNDLNNIPKQIMKDGMILDLITTNWEVTETRQLQDNSIPSKYKATCYYATKKRVDNPLTYIVTAEYNGTADKVIENDFTYEIIYKHISTDINYIPTIVVLSSTTLIVVILFIRRKKNVIIYNFQNKVWKEIGKQRISKPIVKLDRYNYKVKSNRYKIELDEEFINKHNGKMIKIKRQKRTIDKFLNKSNNITPYTIDIVI